MHCTSIVCLDTKFCCNHNAVCPIDKSFNIAHIPILTIYTCTRHFSPIWHWWFIILSIPNTCIVIETAVLEFVVENSYIVTRKCILPSAMITWGTCVRSGACMGLVELACGPISDSASMWSTPLYIQVDMPGILWAQQVILISLLHKKQHITQSNIAISVKECWGTNHSHITFVFVFTIPSTLKVGPQSITIRHGQR